MRGIAWLLFVSWLAGGCIGGEAPEPGAEPLVVAKVDGAPITDADLESHVGRVRQPHRRITREDLEALLEERVLEEALYREALRREVDRDPEMQAKVRQIVVGRLIEEHLDEAVWNIEIEDEALQAYYDAHASEFNRPGQARLADIFIAVPQGATEVERATRRHQAEAILAEAIKARQTPSGFGRLIEEHSDPPEKYRKGDTGFFDEKGRPAGIALELARVAHGMERVGSLHEEVVEAPDGFHVVMLTGKRSGVHVPLENVRHTLTQRIRRESAARIKREFLEQVREDADVQVEERALAVVLERINGEAPHVAAAANPSAPGGLRPPSLPDVP